MLTIRRTLLLTTLLGVSGVVVFFLLHRDPDAPKSSWPELTDAATAVEPVKIKVAPNVRVSVGDLQLPYWECVAACDPSDARIVYAASMVRRNDGPMLDIAVFVSRDGGDSWNAACYRNCPEGHAFNDPTLTVAADGTAYLAYMDVDAAQREVGELVFLASTDTGENWEERGRHSSYVDRPWLAIDRSSDARIYCFGQRATLEDRKWSEPVLLSSSDGLRNLSELLTPHTGPAMVNCRPANPVVFADGELFLAYMDRYRKHRITVWPRPAIYTAVSTDAGASFSPRQPVNTSWWSDSISSGPSGCFFPKLAIDKSNSRERLICVWDDGRNTHNETRVFLCISQDRGRRWSLPVQLSEQSLSAGPDYIATRPAIAVTEDGVIGVCWYDRRGLPPVRSVPLDDGSGVSMIETLGWNVRMRISTDGGATWHSSVQLNEQPGSGDLFVGHTLGLAASADGRFHATWVDNRSGESEIWTCLIELEQNLRSRFRAPSAELTDPCEPE